MNKEKIKTGNAKAKNAIKKGFHFYRGFVAKKLIQWDGCLKVRHKWIVYTTILLAIILLLTLNLIKTISNSSQVYAVDRFESIDPYGIKMQQVPKYDPMKGRAIGMLEYLDSLKTDTNGKEIYDSIIQARPGLLDSIHYYINR